MNLLRIWLTHPQLYHDESGGGEKSKSNIYLVSSFWKCPNTCHPGQTAEGGLWLSFSSPRFLGQGLKRSDWEVGEHMRTEAVGRCASQPWDASQAAGAWGRCLLWLSRSPAPALALGGVGVAVATAHAVPRGSLAAQQQPGKMARRRCLSTGCWAGGFGSRRKPFLRVMISFHFLNSDL